MQNTFGVKRAFELQWPAASRLDGPDPESRPGARAWVIRPTDTLPTLPDFSLPHDGKIYLHSRAFLSAATRKSLAGKRGTSGFRCPLSRLERTHNCRMLCA